MTEAFDARSATAAEYAAARASILAAARRPRAPMPPAPAPGIPELDCGPIEITSGAPIRVPTPAAPQPVNARTMTREAWQAERAHLLWRI